MDESTKLNRRISPRHNTHLLKIFSNNSQIKNSQATVTVPQQWGRGAAATEIVTAGQITSKV